MEESLHSDAPAGAPEKGMSCAVCGLPSSQKCSACHASWYCTGKHQRDDWKNHRKTCTPMILKEDPVYGRHWVASRDLKEGVLLVKEAPSLKVPAWPSSTFAQWQSSAELKTAQCLACGAYIDLRGGHSYRCSKCTWPVCSAACERNPVHSGNECAVFKLTKFKFPPPRQEISPKRIDWSAAMIRLGRLKSLKRQEYDEIMALQHEPDLPPDDMIVEGLNSAIVTMNYYFTTGRLNYLRLTSEEMLQALWVIKLNGINCSTSDTHDDIASARQDCIFLKTSMFSNSCSPNCSQSQVLKGPDYVMRVRTAVPVKKGEPLTIAYSGSDCYGTIDRQRELRAKFYFICKCSRCVDPSELGTYMSSVACSACLEDKGQAAEGGAGGGGGEGEGEDLDPNSGYLLPEDPLAIDDDTAVWTCNRCGKATAASSFMPRVIQLGDSIKSRREPDHSFYRGIIEEHSGRFLHPNHWVMQMAASCILSRYHAQDDDFSPRFDIEEYKRLASFRLAIQNVVNPGLSFVRVIYQRDYIRTVLPRLSELVLESSAPVTEEIAEQVKVCLKMLDQAIDYYRMFRESMPDAGPNAESLASMKDTIERLQLMK